MEGSKNLYNYTAGGSSLFKIARFDTFLGEKINITKPRASVSGENWAPLSPVGQNPSFATEIREQ